MIESRHYNVYDTNWNYLGEFWCGMDYFKHKNDGDYILYNERIEFLTKKGIECYTTIKTYIKYMGIV